MLKERFWERIDFTDPADLFSNVQLVSYADIDWLLIGTRKAILEEVMTVLDKAELEHWFDMSDSTENWKTWKKIRNLIRDE